VTSDFFFKHLDLRTEARLGFLKCIGLKQYQHSCPTYNDCLNYWYGASSCGMLFLEEFVLFFNELKDYIIRQRLF
jgi:hypothetical protein